jgi:hypothetical protein
MPSTAPAPALTTARQGVLRRVDLMVVPAAQAAARCGLVAGALLLTGVVVPHADGGFDLGSVTGELGADVAGADGMLDLGGFAIISSRVI